MTFTFMPSPSLLDSPVGRSLFGDVPDTLTIDPTLEIPAMCRVAIIGGGVAGIALAVRLWHAGLLDEALLIEQSPTLLGPLFSHFATLNQRVMRSPYEHHVGVENVRDCEMLDLARANWRHLTETERQEVRMAQSGQRSVVPVDVFRSYICHIVEAHGVMRHVRQGFVRAVRAVDSDHFELDVNGHLLSARHVVWAVGERPRALPSILQGAVQDGQKGSIVAWDHPDLDFNVNRAVVVGSGMSAAHLLMNLHAHGVHATWVMRSHEQYQCTDVDARFFRPEGRAYFRSHSLDERLGLLQSHREATIMLEFAPLFRSWEEQGDLTVYRHVAILNVDTSSRRGEVMLGLSNGAQVEAERIYAALGSEPNFSPKLDAARPICWKGPYPVLDDESLELANCPGAFVIGGLASLSVGPGARNIDGARIAADHVLAALLR